jgi:hypothetical protein
MNSGFEADLNYEILFYIFHRAWIVLFVDQGYLPQSGMTWWLRFQSEGFAVVLLCLSNLCLTNKYCHLPTRAGRFGRCALWAASIRWCCRRCKAIHWYTTSHTALNYKENTFFSFVVDDTFFSTLLLSKVFKFLLIVLTCFCFRLRNYCYVNAWDTLCRRRSERTTRRIFSFVFDFYTSLSSLSLHHIKLLFAHWNLLSQ